MTGTAKTEEEEFYKVYALETLVIPTNNQLQELIIQIMIKMSSTKKKYGFMEMIGLL